MACSIFWLSVGEPMWEPSRSVADTAGEGRPSQSLTLDQASALLEAAEASQLHAFIVLRDEREIVISSDNFRSMLGAAGKRVGYAGRGVQIILLWALLLAAGKSSRWLARRDRLSCGSPGERVRLGWGPRDRGSRL